MLFVFLFVTYFLSMTLSRSIPVSTNDPVSLFMWLSNSPLYIWTTSSVIHSSVDGHLGCFHVLAVVNSAHVSIGP